MIAKRIIWLLSAAKFIRERAGLFSSLCHSKLICNKFFFSSCSSYDDEEDYESNIDILESHMESHMDDQVACDINEL